MDALAVGHAARRRGVGAALLGAAEQLAARLVGVGWLELELASE